MTAVPILPAGAGPADAGEAELLLVAYQCGPGLGSVSQLGWQWFTGLAARRGVCLVTHVRNRSAIEAAPDRPPGRGRLRLPRGFQPSAASFDPLDQMQDGLRPAVGGYLPAKAASMKPESLDSQGV